MAVYGVGIYEKGKYITKVNGVPTKCYRTWQGIIERCYHPDREKKFPTYIDCKLDERWFYFQAFAEWWHNQPFHDYPNYHLDKDLLVKGNRIYGPDFCRFVPRELNNLTTSCKAVRGEYPIGVCYDITRNSIKACIKIRGRSKHLGVFEDANEAHLAYKIAKEKYIKELAEEYKDKIAYDLYLAIRERKVDIDD